MSIKRVFVSGDVSKLIAQFGFFLLHNSDLGNIKNKFLRSFSSKSKNGLAETLTEKLGL